MSSSTRPSLILTLDVGSSSIRCSAHRGAHSQPNERYPEIKTIPEFTIVRKLSSVHPNTGKIILYHYPSSNDSFNNNEKSEDKSNLLMDTIDICIDEILNKIGENFEVIGLGFSTFCMNLIGVDRCGKVVGEEATLSYACNDVQVVQECERLKKQLGIHKLHQLHQRTGSPLHTSYALPQLMSYYKQNRSTDTQQRLVHKWQTISSLCLSRWIGNFLSPSSSSSSPFCPISYSEASFTGLFNFHSCEWDKECTTEILDEEVMGALPDVADYDDIDLVMEETINVRNDDGTNKRQINKYWDRWPKLRSCRFVLGIGDGACANIGSKCTTSARVAVTIGTSAAARVCVPLPISKKRIEGSIEMEEGGDMKRMTVPQGLFCYRINKSQVLLGGALTDGGSVVDWIRKLLNLNCDDDFESCLKDAMTSYLVEVAQSDLSANTCDVKEGQELSPNNLTVIPFLSGERSTGFRSGANGCVIGLNRQTSPSDLVRACLEGVILRLNAILALISGAVERIEDSNCIVISGNALEKNSLWRQMLADCAGRQVIKDSDANEGTSRGMAILVSLALYGDKKTYRWTDIEVLKIVDEQVPNKHAKGLWKRLETSQEKSIQCVTPMWK